MEGQDSSLRASESEAKASYTISTHFSLVLSPVLPSPLPNVIPSVLCVLGSPFKLSLRFAAGRSDSALGVREEEEATGAGEGFILVAVTGFTEGVETSDLTSGVLGVGVGESIDSTE